MTNFINGKKVTFTGDFIDVISPLNGETISQVPLSESEIVDSAVNSARAAFTKWSEIPIKERVQIFYRYKNLLEKNLNELAGIIHEENGKTIAEATAEVEKSIELTEFACSLPQLVQGEILEVSSGVECRSDRHPLGVVASIAPFNFPNMVTHWTMPNAVTLGNAMILKPSEQVPISAMRIAELLTEAGLPEGLFNIVNGSRNSVEAICDHPDIDAVSFVGSTKVAEIIYQRAASKNKRVLTLGSAKNYLIVLPDANQEMTASDVAASMSGCAGQRCMAAAAVLAVGDVDQIITQISEEAKMIIPGKNLGAIISKKAQERIEDYISEAERQGADILVDGRRTIVKDNENGFYVGPTVIDRVTPEMKIAQEEVFGPVLSIIRIDTIDEALEIENSSQYGNAAAVFTQSGGLAKYVAENTSAGMIGVNIGVPVPREPFAFGGWNRSKFGAGDITGKSSIEFWTKQKKVTTKWNPEAKTNWMS